MKMENHRIAAIHDISGYGRGSLTTAIASLSSMGYQVLPVPTAVLSSHTGIEGYTFRDLTEDLRGFIRQWKEKDLHFEAIYTGFLGSAEQSEIVGEFIDTFRDDETVVLVDPVMGDDNKLYKTCTPELVAGMKELVKKADVVTPNLTEAGVLYGWDIMLPPRCERCLKKFLYGISDMGPKHVIVTGLPILDEQVGVACYDGETKAEEIFYKPAVEAEFPGAGDLFASIYLGYYLKNRDMVKSAHLAADFMLEAVQLTVESERRRYDYEGLMFEPLLYKLHENMQ